MPKENSYTAHGLQINSEVPLPGLLPGLSQEPDVRIRYGSVPLALPNPQAESGNFQAAPDTFLLGVPDVGRFLVEKGQDILIERFPNCQEDILQLFLLGSAFGALLHQRGLLAMHASTIQTDRGGGSFCRRLWPWKIDLVGSAGPAGLCHAGR
jgi:hypothetical protein